MKKIIRPSVRAIILNWDKFLVCKMGKCHWIPWWWIDFWETLCEALSRETLEELNIEGRFKEIFFVQDFIRKWNDWNLYHAIEHFCLIENNVDFFNVLENYKLASHSYEISDLKWCSIYDVPKDFMPVWLLDCLGDYFLDKKGYKCRYITQKKS